MFFFAKWDLKPYIKVVELQLLERLVQGSLDLLGPVAVVPELGGDEDVLALQAGDVVEGLLDALGDLGLVLVDLGQVEVAVAGLEGLVDAGANLARRGLPGAVAEGWDLVARGEGESLSERHFGGVLVVGGG